MGVRNRLGLPPGGPRRAPVRWTHWSETALLPLTETCASHHCCSLPLSMTPGARLLPLLVAVSTVVAVVASEEPTTALSPATGGVTLAFVFDVTGSMWDDLMQVIDGASRILERSLSSRSRVITNYALVPFHDPGSSLCSLRGRPPSTTLRAPWLPIAPGPLWGV